MTLSTFVLAMSLDFELITRIVKTKYNEECGGPAYIVYAGIDENENGILDEEEFEVSNLYCKDLGNENA